MSVKAMACALAVRGVTASEKLLLLALANYADDEMRCWPSQKRLAEDTCLNERTLRRTFAALEDRRMVSRTVRRRADGTQTTSVVTLHFAGEVIRQADTSPPYPDTVSAYPDTTPPPPDTVSPLTTFEPSLEPSEERELARARLRDVREQAGDALADLARSPGIASLHALTSLLAEPTPCLWREDVLPAIASAAAWHRSRDGPGSMTTWTAAARMARRNRDNRLNPPKPNEQPDNSRQNAAANRNGNRAHANLSGAALALARRRAPPPDQGWTPDDGRPAGPALLPGRGATADDRL